VQWVGAPSQEVVEHYSTPSRPGGDFRGQILEMMRWAVRCCPVIPDDDGAFNDPVLTAKIAAAQSAQRL